MQIPLNKELRSICQSISAKRKSLSEWSAIESDDMFQSDSFCGGFDADELAFLFSWRTDYADEYWFQLTLDQVAEIASGGSPQIVGTPVEVD